MIYPEIGTGAVEDPYILYSQREELEENILNIEDLYNHYCILNSKINAKVIGKNILLLKSSLPIQIRQECYKYFLFEDKTSIMDFILGKKIETEYLNSEIEILRINIDHENHKNSNKKVDSIFKKINDLLDKLNGYQPSIA